MTNSLVRSELACGLRKPFGFVANSWGCRRIFRGSCLGRRYLSLRQLANKALQTERLSAKDVRLQEKQTVHLRTDAFDVWAYRKDKDAVRYLLLHTSQEKADRWFNGGRFWQIPAEFTKEGETLQVAAQRCLSEIGVAAKSLWAVEHSYTIFNRRYQDIQLILVLAAEVEDSSNIRLSWEHSLVTSSDAVAIDVSCSQGGVETERCRV